MDRLSLGRWRRRRTSEAATWLGASILALALFAAGCGGAPASTGDATADTVAPPADAGADVADADSPLSTGPCGFGEACVDGSDCASGFCIETSAGNACTEPCVDSCPPGWTCASAPGWLMTVAFFCVPRETHPCGPCLPSCEACVAIDGEARCAVRCDGPDDCPPAFACEVDDADATVSYCRPPGGTCACSSALAGARRGCVRGDGAGLCRGHETCDPAIGWHGCDARSPLEPACDGSDSVCSGFVDRGAAHPTCAHGGAPACGRR